MFVSVFVAETCAGKKSYKTNILQTIYQFVLRWFGSFEINNLCTDEGTFNILFVKKKPQRTRRVLQKKRYVILERV